MASPWKFLARLVSPRRQQKQDDGAIDVMPDVAAVAGQAYTRSIEESADQVDQPTRKNLPPAIRTEAVLAEPEPLAQSGGDSQGTADSNGNEGAEDSEPALHDIGATPAYDVPIVKQSPNAASGTGTGTGRAKRTAPVAIELQTAAVVPTISDEISLDQEIRMLRGQLTSKLRLQNTQLRKMLERFER